MSLSASVFGLTRSKNIFDNFITIFLFSISAGQTVFNFPTCGNAKRCTLLYTKSFMRAFSILAYFFIFLSGSMILLPYGLLLLTGLFTAEPIMRILVLLADISLIALLIISFNEKSRTTLIIEIVSYFVLLLPLLKIFVSFPFPRFNYFLFIFPTVCFIILFPLSIFLSYRKPRRKMETNGNLVDF